MPENVKELLVEITKTGGWQRVAVLDPETGREGIAHGPLHAQEDDLLKLAIDRLRQEPAPRKRDGGVVV